jgi:hypothetical protein
MKATVPCYNFLYNHVSPRVRAKIDRREQTVEQAEQAALKAVPTDAPSTADKVRHAVRKTIVTKRVVDLFITNMSENDKPENMENHE